MLKAHTHTFLKLNVMLKSWTFQQKYEHLQSISLFGFKVILFSLQHSHTLTLNVQGCRFYEYIQKCLSNTYQERYSCILTPER